MYTYKAFGLGFHSEIPLPELVEYASLPDVLVRVNKPCEVPREAIGVPRWIQRIENGVLFAWDRVGTFRIRAGQEILVTPAPHTEERVLRLFILGASVSVLLQQRGYTVLHASAVSVGGNAVAFVGEKGMGKSSLAATLQVAKHPLLADDTIALVTNGQGTPVVLPGYPQLKLWPDTIEYVMGGEVGDFSRLRSGLQKRAVGSIEYFSRHPATLTGIFVLAHGDETRIEDLAPRDSLLRLLPHWYGARFGSELLDTLGRSTHLLQCGKVVSNVPVLLLRRPSTLDSLREMARLVQVVVADSNAERATP